jgi:hypothetical protein
MHAPVQITYPEWGCGIDHDPAEAAEPAASSRR